MRSIRRGGALGRAQLARCASHRRSVDDGKSTLIGRLLLDGQALLADQIDALGAHADDGAPDLALATDGLEAEREQGITIDVAHRYFATPARKFVIADAPGHEQYTRNMVTAAAGSDAAVVLVDATKLATDGDGGVELLSQTRRSVLSACRVPQSSSQSQARRGGDSGRPSPDPAAIGFSRGRHRAGGSVPISRFAVTSQQARDLERERRPDLARAAGNASAAATLNLPAG